MRRLLGIILALLVLGSGCSGNIPLSERSIVKAVYVDNYADSYTAGLCVANVAGNADTAETDMKIEIYTGSGSTVEQALQQAEKQQNKQMFYEHNQLLLLGEGAAAHLKDISDYFCREDVLKTNMYAVLTSCTVEELQNMQDSLAQSIASLEQMMQSGTRDVMLQKRIYELQKPCGWLPVVTLNADKPQGELKGVQVYSENGLAQQYSDEAMQMLLLLDGAVHKLQWEIGQHDAKLQFTVEDISLSKSIVAGKNGPVLQIYLAGNIRHLIENDLALHDTNKQKQAMERINAYVQQLAQTILTQTFGRGEDLFQYSAFFNQYSVQKTQEMKQLQTLYLPQRVQFISALQCI